MTGVIVQDMDVSYVTRSRRLDVIRGFSAEFPARKVVAATGRSGSGKSSFLHVIAGLQRPTSGRVTVFGQTLDWTSPAALAQYRMSTVAVATQIPLLHGYLSARDNIVSAIVMGGDMSLRRAADQADEMLDAVDLADRADHHPHQLSVGEQQRVALARALALDRPLTLLDEPTAALDVDRGEMLMRLIRRRVDGGGLVVVATHDPSLLEWCDQVIVVGDDKASAPAAS